MPGPHIWQKVVLLMTFLGSFLLHLVLNQKPWRQWHGVDTMSVVTFSSSDASKIQAFPLPASKAV